MADSIQNAQAAFTLITHLEGHLKAAVELAPVATENWLLTITLMYDGAQAGKTSFNLNGYSRTEAEAIARTIKTNPFIMKEIDEFLWGESD